MLDSEKPLVRGLGLVQATSLNVANMVGIGPFITIPLFIAAMNGPHALIGWVVAAVLVLCDGLVWAELGAALPGSGGSYHFLRVIFGGSGWGRLIPFLFIWQFLVSGTLEMASGYLGAVDYLAYAAPGLLPTLAEWGVPGGKHIVAAVGALAVTLLLCRNIVTIGRLGVLLCAGTIITVATMIVAGLANFDASLLVFPEHAFRLDAAFATGLGAAMLIAIYDYLGYYNICHLGDEVREPAKTIPRAVIVSIVLVAAIYLTMNLGIIGVIPWQEAKESKNIAADFMEKLYGRPFAVAFTWLILWTCLASVFALLLGYSRIPYAAAKNGDFFQAFGYVHPTKRYPAVSLLALGGLTAAFCFLELETVIKAAVTVRIVVQFITQNVALHYLRVLRPDVPLPFRMRLYPIPSLIANVGWLFVLFTTDTHILQAAIVVLLSGLALFYYYSLWHEKK
jgi:amino acid transporter